MKNKTAVLIIGIIILLGISGIVAYKKLVRPASPPIAEEPVEEILPPADESIKVDAIWSKSNDNTVLMSVQGLGGKIVSLEYEVTYESEGIIQGVNSGSKPIDVTGKDSFEREVYLGTCSRNVCKPHLNVKKVSVVLTFTAIDGKKSQFSQDYEL